MRMYGLHFARAYCPAHRTFVIKRRLYVPYRTHAAPCPDHPQVPALIWRRAWWSWYVHVMATGQARYVQESNYTG
jgi:hypothetical protein